MQVGTTETAVFNGRDTRWLAARELLLIGYALTDLILSEVSHD